MKYALLFIFITAFLEKSVILMTKVFLFPLLVLEKTKISEGVIFMIAHWFRSVLTLVFRLPKAGSAEYLLTFCLTYKGFVTSLHITLTLQIESCLQTSSNVPHKFLDGSSFI